MGRVNSEAKRGVCRMRLESLLWVTRARYERVDVGEHATAEWTRWEE
jgi:hypothetical protein